MRFFRAARSDAPSGAGDNSGRRSGMMGAGFDCQWTRNDYCAKELCVFVLLVHLGGPLYGAASAALSGLLWRLLERQPCIGSHWTRLEADRVP